MNRRRPIKHTATFTERLANEAKRLKELARRTAPGHDRNMILSKISNVETALQYRKKDDGAGAPTAEIVERN